MESIQNQNVQVIWQCGKLYFEEYKSIILPLFKSSLLSKECFVYASADIIISEQERHQYRN
jgi:UDP-N-acetylglucosamine--N-acetylmuramyl-(pentapeptide) pyrophosphoryl-undecaprenol N-acetylglucosamine transferase